MVWVAFPLTALGLGRTHGFFGSVLATLWPSRHVSACAACMSGTEGVCVLA